MMIKILLQSQTRSVFRVPRIHFVPSGCEERPLIFAKLQKSVNVKLKMQGPVGAQIPLSQRKQAGCRSETPPICSMPGPRGLFFEMHKSTGQLDQSLKKASRRVPCGPLFKPKML